MRNYKFDAEEKSKVEIDQTCGRAWMYRKYSGLDKVEGRKILVLYTTCELCRLGTNVVDIV